MPSSHFRFLSFFPILLVLLVASCGLVDDDFNEQDQPFVTTADDLVVNEKTRVTLTSSIAGTFDGTRSYQWVQTSGPPVVLQGVDSATATFVAPEVLAQDSPLVLTFTVTLDVVSFDSSTSTVTVFVNAVNDAPVAENDSDIVEEGETITLVVTDNDIDGDGAIALDGIEIVSAPQNGDTVVNEDGSIAYTHDGSESLSDSFTYTVRDNDGTSSNEATVALTVNPVNDPPVANSGTLVTDEETKIDSTLSATDIDSELTFFIASDPPLGAVTLKNSKTGAFTYTPNLNATGSDTFDFGVKDEEFIVTAQMTIIISPDNDAPVFTSAAPIQATVGTAYTYAVTVSDPDGDDLTITVPKRPGWLTLTNTGNGTATLSGVPRSRDEGNNAVKLQAQDNRSPKLKAEQTFTIVVVEPEATEAKASHGIAGSCWSISQEVTLRASLASPEFSSLSTYSIVGNPEKGMLTLVDPRTGVFEYVAHRDGPRGPDNFTYRVDDPRKNSVVKAATVLIDQKLMPMGDDITDGVVDGTDQGPPVIQRSGYRKPLYDALLEAGYHIDFVGSKSSGSSITGFDVDHEGHQGWTADEIAFGRDPQVEGGVFAWLEKNSADVVLLHVGTYGLNANPMGVESILDEIDRWEVSANGNPVTVILAQIIDQTPLNVDVKAFNENMQTMVLDRVVNPDNVAYPDRVIMVDQHSALVYPGDLSDALHPNESGYEKMGRRWFEVLTDPESGILYKCP
ncbi:MAG: tandem-95 repeat protein [Gammaproteobacteria bacterium]|nr:tandem-95 repeat protein [Gammaproteobacteria bacterium]